MCRLIVHLDLVARAVALATSVAVAAARISAARVALVTYSSVTREANAVAAHVAAGGAAELRTKISAAVPHFTAALR